MRPLKLSAETIPVGSIEPNNKKARSSLNGSGLFVLQTLAAKQVLTMPNLSRPAFRGNRPSAADANSDKRLVHAPDRVSGSCPPDPATGLDGGLWRGITSSDCYLYFDKVKYLKEAITSEADETWMRSQCRDLDIRYHGDWVVPKRGKPYQINIWPKRERIEVHGPTPALRDYFANRNDVHLSGADVASDLTFDDEDAKYRVLAIFERHLIQPHQRKTRKNMQFANGGISTGSKRRKSNYFTGYVSKPCRIDGIADCWHFEDRRRGTRSLKQLGIYHARDLATFDHAKYWKQFEDSGHLLDIDFERLGRNYSNKYGRKKRRESDPTPFHGRRSEDHWLGTFLFRRYGTDEDDGHLSVQTFIRNYGKGPYIIKLAYLSGLGFENNIFQIGMVDTAHD